MKERSNSLRRQESDVFVEDDLPRVSSGPLSPTSFEVGASFKSAFSGPIASNEDSPERRPTASAESIVSSNKTPPKDPSNESLNQLNSKFVVGTTSGSKELQLRRYSSLNLSDTPHMMYACSSSKDYLEKMASLLQDVNRNVIDLERNTRGVPSPAVQHRDALGSAKDTASGQQQPQVSNRMGKRINSSDVMMMDGIIMRPTSIDLVGRSGLLSMFFVQGLTSAKLEGVSCFGGNVLILIEAQVLLDVEGKEGAQQRVALVSKMTKQPRLVLGRKLTEKSVLRKYVKYEIISCVYLTICGEH